LPSQIAIVFAFTLIIHCIATLAYSVRLVGIKTGRLAVSFALFNILVLVSRISNAVQAPLLSKKIEQDIANGLLNNAGFNFHLLILAASTGTLLGALLIPTFQRIFTRIVMRFNTERSIPSLLIHGFSKAGIKQIRSNLRIPSRHSIQHLKEYKKLPKRLIILNTIAVSILTVGTLSALYASYFNPQLRVTSSNLAPIVTGLAAILLVIFIDPYFSLLTDDVLEGKRSELYFRKCVLSMVISRFIGTLIAQALLLPAAKMIVFFAKIIPS